METDERPSAGALADLGIWTARFSGRALEKIAGQAAPVQRVGARSTLNGDGRGRRFYALVQGWAYSHRDFADGRRYVIAIHPPGDLVGLEEAWAGAPVPYVSTLTDVVAIPFDGARAAGLAREDAEVASGFASVLADELADRNAHLGSLARHTAYERVACLLKALRARQYPNPATRPAVFRCPVSQQVIGDALGLSVVHVNRSLRRLAESGVLQKRSGEVEVLDDAAFEQIGRD
jgi:CRP-like cAMP-binding protein